MSSFLQVLISQNELKLLGSVKMNHLKEVGSKFIFVNLCIFVRFPLKKNNIIFEGDKHFYCCKDIDKNCEITKDHMHCKLCDKTPTGRYNCQRHFQQCHEKRVIIISSAACYPCKVNHFGSNNCGRAHFHCPKCEKTVINQTRFVSHLSSHDKPAPSSRPSPIHPNQCPIQHRSNPRFAPICKVSD